MTRTLLVDDSPTVRKLLRKVLTEGGGFDIIGEAQTAAEAVASILELKPELVLLDVFLPDGTAGGIVREVLSRHPVPIVLVSDAPRESNEVFEALEAGALDFLRKPRAQDVEAFRRIVETARALSRVKVRKRRPNRAPASIPPLRLVAIGSSAGGPAGLRELLAELPKDFPAAVLVAQHVAEGFEAGFTRWLQDVCALPVSVCGDEERIERGRVLVGRAGCDLLVRPSAIAACVPAAPRGYHPSVDALFSSAASHFGASAVGVVLSGMGSDGVHGARALVQAGGLVFAQDRATAPVFGMPGAVRRAGLVHLSASPSALGRALVQEAQRRGLDAKRGQP